MRPSSALRAVLFAGGPIAMIAAVLQLTGMVVNALDSMATSYIRAESQWSKAQKTSFLNATRGLLTSSPGHIEVARRELAPVDGMRTVREAIIAPEADFAQARRGFARAGIPAEEHYLMYYGPRWFKLGPLTEALQIWEEADAEIAYYRTLLELIEQHVDGHPTAAGLLDVELRRVDAELKRKTVQFSALLVTLRTEITGFGRWFQWILAGVIVLVWTSISVRSTRIVNRQRRHIQRQADELRMLELALDRSPVGVGLIDENKMVVYSNPAREKLFGRTLEQINALGGSYQFMEFDEDAEARMARFEDLKTDIKIIQPDGHKITVALQATPVIKPDGEHGGYFGFFTDVTDLRAREARERQHVEDTRKAKEQAEVAALAKTRFLATMSHEIRTPIHAVMGLTSLVLDTHLDEQQRSHLLTVHRSAESLLSILNDILDFSKIEGGHLELENITFDVRESLSSVINMLVTRAQDRRVALSFDVDNDVPTHVSGDPTRLRQILVNLVGNAIKFTAEGTVTVHVAARAIEQTRVELHFKVIDSGIGLAADQIGRLFQPFSQADESTTRRYGGTGLGLSISRQLSDLMGGRLWAESRGLGYGATFHFTTQHDRAARVQAPRDASDTTPLRSLRVLVAEDDAVNRRIADAFLERLGVQSAVAEDGAEAVRIVGEQEFDVVLMDVQMPVMDGIQATRTIRGSLDRQPYIIALTANAFADDKRSCLESGMNAYLSKPLRPQDLTNALLEAVRFREARVVQQSPDATMSSISTRSIG